MWIQVESDRMWKARILKPAVDYIIGIVCSLKHKTEHLKLKDEIIRGHLALG